METKSNQKSTFIPLHYRPRVKGEKIDASKVASPIDYSAKKTLIEAIVCLYLKEDCSQTKSIQQHVKEDNLLFLTYDDLGILWNFSYFKGELFFYTHTHIIKPKGIYNRPYCMPGRDPRFYIFNNFLRIIELWKGPMIGAKASNFHNSSKPYQLTTTIRKTIKDLKYGRFVSFPKSYFVKGVINYRKLLSKSHDLIVKSCSGIRSEVATHEIFNDWDKNALENLPTFFQTICLGPDIRMHWMGKDCFSVILNHKKGSIDYRYAKERGVFEKLKPIKELRSFAKKIAKIESLKLAGIDFIKVKNTYVCLECNPNPGWAGFHRYCKDEPKMANALIQKLVRK